MPSFSPSGSGYTSPTSAKKVAEGRFFLAGTGRMTLSVAGNLRMELSNPAASGKNISVVRIAGLATATGWASIILNPTTGRPASAARPVLNAVLGGGLAAVAQIKADTDATVPMAGGTDTGIVLGIPGGSRTQLDLPPLIVAQGVTMGVNVPFAGAADSALSVYWIEDPV